MFRFTMPQMPDRKERLNLLKKQCEEFLNSRELKEVFDILGTDQETFLIRQKTEAIEVEDTLMKTALYPMLDGLGFFHINKPLSREHDYILVLGGRSDACYERTVGAGKWVTERTLSVDGLTADRRIEEDERKNARFFSAYDTETGVLTEAFLKVLGCDGIRYRIFEASSAVPDGRRADTGETFAHYLKQTIPVKGSSFLAVTHNRYCNRQFLQMAYYLLKADLKVDLDVVGVIDDERIVSPERYDATAILRDLYGVLYWIEKIGELK